MVAPRRSRPRSPRRRTRSSRWASPGRRASPAGARSARSPCSHSARWCSCRGTSTRLRRTRH
ncbi:MAG TPA: hypothetical protein DCP95_05660 [Microbacterium ginsengisoli]|uniref:Uncharacterized protein n=1 Tax=Microbacterium ginsengisoli TaxID=400772 RepID=A0A3C1KBL1_9MICO|nr:hypothetical protein [Microbacterium ginsengisoli]